MLLSYAAHHMEIIIGISLWFRATTLKYAHVHSHLKTKKGYDVYSSGFITLIIHVLLTIHSLLFQLFFDRFVNHISKQVVVWPISSVRHINYLKVPLVCLKVKTGSGGLWSKKKQ